MPTPAINFIFALENVYFIILRRVSHKKFFDKSEVLFGAAVFLVFCFLQKL